MDELDDKLYRAGVAVSSQMEDGGMAAHRLVFNPYESTWTITTDWSNGEEIVTSGEKLSHIVKPHLDALHAKHNGYVKAGLS